MEGLPNFSPTCLASFLPCRINCGAAKHLTSRGDLEPPIETLAIAYNEHRKGGESMGEAALRNSL